jgi:hypothetical protein
MCSQCRRQNLSRIKLLTAITLMAITLGACAAGGGGSRGKVSEAANQSAENESETDNNADRESGRTRTKTDHFEDEEEDEGNSFLSGLIFGIFSSEEDLDDPAYYEDTDDRTSDNDTEFDGRNLILWLSRSNLGGDTIDHLNTATLLYSFFRTEHLRTQVGIFYGDAIKGSQALVQDGMDNMYEMGLDIGFRAYATPRHTLMGAYVLVGFRYSSLNWSYTQQILVPGNENLTISSDGVSVITPYLGCGTSILQTKPFHLGASMSWGPRFTMSETYEGFENDLFVDVGELRLNLELSVFF